MNPSAPRSDSSPHDGRLYELVDEFSQRISCGDPITADEFAAMHAEYSEDLLSILPALTVLCDLSEPPISALRSSDSRSVAAVPQSLGDFHIIRQIGQGGMGFVYEAEQMSLGRRVAVKVLPFAGMLSKNQLQRFKNEAHAAASLHHPHIVNAFFFGQERGVHFYSMQLIEGQSLAEIIQALSTPEDAEGPDALAETQPVAALSTSRSRDRLEFYRTVARIGTEVADALTYAHSLGIIHRDIKPSNILIDRDHHTWVTDFGLASTRTESNLTLTGDVLGTLRYMSPEQASGNAHLDHRTDVYSLGVTLYELSTGRPVLDGSNQAELIKQLEDSEPPSPRSLDSRIPRDLERILFKAIAKSRSDRYDSAQELSEDLQRFFENKPVRARRLTRRQRVWRWCERNRSLAVALTTVAILLLLLGTIGPMLAVRAIASSRAAIRTNYSSSTLNAYEAWHQGRIDRIPDLLWTHNDDPYVVRLRGWEWEHLWNRYRSLADIQSYRFGGSDAAISLSPDGKKLAVFGRGEDAGVLQFHDANELTLLSSIETSRVVAGAFTTDNRMFIGMCGDHVIRGWDTADLKELFQVTAGPGNPYGFRISPRGDLLAIARYGENRVDIWSLEQVVEGAREPLRSLEHRNARAVAFSGDGKRIAVCSLYGQVAIWSIDDAKRLNTSFRIDGSTTINFLAFHPSRDLLATSGNGVRLWNPNTGQLVARLGDASRDLTSLAFSTDGTMLVAGSGRQIELWDVDQQIQIDRLRSQASPCRQVVFSPEGTCVFANCGRNGLICRFPISTVSRAHTSATFVEFVGESQRHLAISSHAYRLEEEKRGAFHLWDLERKTAVRREPPGPYGATACSPADREQVAILSGSTIALRNVARQTELKALHGHQSNVETAAFSPDGKFLATVALRKPGVPELMLWDLKDAQPTPTPLPLPDEFRPYRAAFSPNGRILLVAGGSWKGVAKVYRYDVESNSLIDTFCSDSKASLFLGLCFSSDGNYVATGGHGGRRIFCFDWRRRKQPIEMHTEGGTDGWVLALTFTPDGKRLAAGHPSGRVSIWERRTGDQVAVLDAGSPVYDVKFSADGNTLAAGCGNGTAVLWGVDGRKETIVP